MITFCFGVVIQHYIAQYANALHYDNEASFIHKLQPRNIHLH